mgnify:CR=1 FL=1
MMEMLNKLDFSKKEVVKTLLNIIQKDELNYHLCDYMQFGFFVTEEDWNEFKNNLETDDLEVLLEQDFKFTTYGTSANDLMANHVWIKYQYMEILSFESVKTYLEECNQNDGGMTENLLKNNYGHIINGLLKCSLSP